MRGDDGSRAGARLVTRIFIAGASGVIGTELVSLLVSAGHHVAGMTRSEQKADGLQRLGAEPVICNVYDLDELTVAVTRFSPDTVMHQLTDLPTDPSAMSKQLAANNRIRREGTRNLIAAARAADAPRLLAQSVAFDLPGDGGAAVVEHETAVLAADGVALRYGQFYGPGTYHLSGKPAPPAVHVAEAARRTVESLEAPPGVVTIVEDCSA